MKKWRFWLIVVMLGLVVAFSVGATVGEPQLKVQKALGVTAARDVYRIPVGSTVVHLPDGSTRIVGPDGQLVIYARRSEVGFIPTPAGMAKATRVYEVPSGSFVHGASSSTIEIHDADGTLILSVIDQSGEAGLEAVQTSPPAFSGWIEYAHWGPRSYGYFRGLWAVPTAPSNGWIDDDVVYLFNGVYGPGANAWTGRTVILQPVVGYNENGLWPGNPLNGRVWVVNDGGQYVRTSAIGVAVGNLIEGGISLGDPNQPLWTAYISNISTSNANMLTTDLLGTTGQSITVALEGYNLESDSDLFGTTDFVDLQVRDPNWNQIHPSWNPTVDPEARDYFTDLDVVIYDHFHVRLQTAR